MKKSGIRIFIAALLLIVIGAGLFAGGVFAAGGIEPAKEVLAKKGVFLDRGIQIDINQGKGTEGKFSVKNSKLEQTIFSASDVRSLDLEVGAAEVEIIENTSGEDILVRTNGDYNIYMKESVLHLETRKHAESHQLIVEIPSNMSFDSVDIEAGACKMEVDSLNTRELEVEVGAGTVVIKQCTLQEGDINVGMGTAEICLDGSFEDYNYEIDCGAGRIQIGHESFDGVATERNIDNHANANVDIECGMGNVVIGF